MTLITCYCPTLMENFTACLRLLPRKLILLGDMEEMKAPSGRYRALMQARGIPMELQLQDIRSQNLVGLSRLLMELVRRERDCVIDLTGAHELVALAVGAMMASLEEGLQVSVQRFDGTQDVDCDGDGRLCPSRESRLTVEELITLHGGTIHPDTYQPARHYTARHIAPLWELVRADPRQWNRDVAVLRELESYSFSQSQVVLPLDQLRGKISNFRDKEDQLRIFLDKLSRRGVVQDKSSRDILHYSYSNELFRYCMEKAGNVLEVKTLLEARDLDGFFQDGCMSVHIDWDGIIYPPVQRKPETRNEMDVVLMRGSVPLFISCKNGNIDDEELYKLHTVAARFGGPAARKLLIATDLERKNALSNRAYAQRAWDMDIYLVTDAAELEPEEWKAVFKTAML